MVKNRKVDFDRILYAISDSTRRGIIDELYRGERSVGELSLPYKISAPAISKHLRILESTGLITTRREGRRVMCNLEVDSVMRVATWLARYEKLWQKRLSTLEQEIRSNMGRNDLYKP